MPKLIRIGMKLRLLKRLQVQIIPIESGSGYSFGASLFSLCVRNKRERLLEIFWKQKN